MDPFNSDPRDEKAELQFKPMLEVLHPVVLGDDEQVRRGRGCGTRRCRACTFGTRVTLTGRSRNLKSRSQDVRFVCHGQRTLERRKRSAGVRIHYLNFRAHAGGCIHIFHLRRQRQRRREPKGVYGAPQKVDTSLNPREGARIVSHRQGSAQGFG
eukprot:7384962-Prymnesium_polylepis.1